MKKMSARQFSLNGKVALITGASNGIGSETAKLFTKLGATVSLLDIDETNLRAVAKECEKLGVGQPKPLLIIGSVTHVDVLKRYIESTVKAFGKIDALVNNAGTTKLTTLLDSPIEDYDDIFNVNVRAIVQLTQLAAPHLIKSQGSVVNVASVAGSRVVAGRLFYGMSKATVQHFTKYVAHELGEHNVRVNSISPGMVKTDILLKYGMAKSELPRYFEETGKKQALQRCGEPQEIAELIAFLSSDSASFITGSDYIIDGGQLVQPSVLAKVCGNSN